MDYTIIIEYPDCFGPLYSKMFQLTISERDWDQAVQAVNPSVRPVGLAAVKFLYTDWLDPANSSRRAAALDQMVSSAR